MKTRAFIFFFAKSYRLYYEENGMIERRKVMLYDNYIGILDDNNGINIYDIDGNSVEFTEMTADQEKEFWRLVLNK